MSVSKSLSSPSNSTWSTCSSSSSSLLSLEDDEEDHGIGIIENSIVDTFILLCNDLPLKTVTTKLLSMKMGYEKVDYLIELLKDNTVFEDFIYKPKENKCNKQSEKLRNKGNDLYKNKNYAEALKYYTKSIAFAENESVYLALAYGNRSALLFEKRYYHQAIADIKSSLCCQCPKKIKGKLLLRMKSCRSLIHKQNAINFCNYFPEVKNKHPKINAASSSIEIRQNFELGRHIVASKNIKLGEVISVEQPYVHQIRLCSKELYCNQCLNPCLNLIPCQNCSINFYCSKECMLQAYNSHHKYTCELSAFQGFNIYLKTFLVAQNEKKGEQSDDHYRSDRSNEIFNLCTNEQKRNPMKLLFYLIIVCQTFLALKKRTKFFQDNIISENEVKNQLYKLIMISEINRFGYQTHMSEELYATGIFSFSSFFNHSCAPNCDYVFHGNSLVIRATEDIKKGQECNISYRFTFESHKLSDRQEGLFKGYDFRCNCKACKNNWYFSTNDELSYHVEISKYINKKKSDEDSINKIIQDVGPLINAMMDHQPNVTLSYLKSVVTDIFKYVGNKTYPPEF